MFSYNDGRVCAGRHPRLYLAKGGEVRKFEGANVPGFCAIAAQRYEKNGNWSNTTFDLELAPGVRPLHFLSPMHGTWGDRLPSWGQVAETLGLPIGVAQDLIRVEYPRTADRLDRLEEFAAAVEASGGGSETVIVSFGSPTNRQIREGYWGEPKSGHTSDGRVVTIRPSDAGRWDEAVIVEPAAGARILSSRHKPGMHGGYWTVEVAVKVAND